MSGAESNDKLKAKGGQMKRSVKKLRSSVEGSVYQKEWFKRTRERISEGEPFALFAAMVVLPLAGELTVGMVGLPYAVTLTL